MLIPVTASHAFPASFAGQRLLDALLFTRLEIIGVSFHFLDDVFLLNSSLEAAKRIFQRLAVLESYFRHKPHPLAVWRFCYPEAIIEFGFRKVKTFLAQTRDRSRTGHSRRFLFPTLWTTY